MFPRRITSPLLPLALTLAACGQPPAPAPPTDPAPPAQTDPTRVTATRIEVTPASTLMTSAGQTVALRATLFDSQGRVVKGTVKWLSDNPTVIEVSAKGVARSRVPVGSARITAEINGVKSEPALVTVARLAPGALLVSDAQIASAPLPLSSSPAGTAVGGQYQVLLNGVTPTVGQVLLSSGQTTLGGRVLASVPNGKQTLVTLETVPLGQLYQDLNVTQHVQVSAADLTPLDGPNAPEQMLRHADGSLTLRYRLPKSGTVQAQRLGAQGLPLPNDGILPGPFDKQEFKVGPFECTSTLDLLLSGDLLSMKIESKLDVDVQAAIEGGTLNTLNVVATGEITGTITGGLDVDVGAQGELKCKAIFARLPVTISGPLAAVAAPSVPIGLGFTLDGKLKLGKVQAALEGKVAAKVNMGLTYDRMSGEVNPISTIDVTSTMSPKLKWPNPVEDLRMEGGLSVFAVTGVDLQAFPWLPSSQLALELIEVTAGPKLEANVAPRTTQAAVTDYASNYALKFVAGIGPGGTLQEAFGVFRTRDQIKKFNPSAVLDITMSRSPTGTFSGPTELKVDQPGDFLVDLNPENVSFVGSYNVESIELWLDKDGTLEFYRQYPAADGETRITFPYIPAAEDAGRTLKFRAFVNTKIGVFPLELNDDATHTVKVTAKEALPDPTDPPPPPPTGGPYRVWTGTSAAQWTGSETSGPSEGTLSTTRTGTGSSSCSLSDEDALGQQAATWTFVLDERIEKVDTNNYRHVTTRAANLSRSSALTEPAHQDDYILENTTVYHLDNPTSPVSIKITTTAVSAPWACILHSVNDENPDPAIFQGQLTTHDPNPSWTQHYQVNAMLKP